MQQVGGVLIRSILCAVIAGVITPAFAQYPQRAVKILVPFPAGSATDAIARIVATQFAQALGQPFVVENKAGADGAIAAGEVARAPADGYTLLMATVSPMAAIPTMKKKPPYDALADFAPISLMGYYSFLLVTHPGVPAKNLQELLAYAKANPGKLNYATGNTTGIMSMLQLQWLGGVKMTHVPYKGEPQAMTDMLSGQIQVMFVTWTIAGGHVREGKLRAIATSLKSRPAYLPDTPTMVEAGLKDFNVLSWAAMYAPARTPKDIVDRLSRELAQMAGKPEVREQFNKIAFEFQPSSPESLGAFNKEQIDVWRKTMAAAGVEPE